MESAGMVSSRSPWANPDAGFRVRYYDARRGGTPHAYFATYDDARSFAMKNRIYARPCEVERRP